MTATQARDRALSSVSASAGPDWMAKALRKITEMRGVATGEGIRLMIEPAIGAPPHHNAWGALIRTAITKGIIEFTGRYEQMKTEKSHARRTPVYQWRARHMPTSTEEIMLHLIDPLRRAIGEKNVETEGDIKQERSKAYGQYCGVLAGFDLDTIKAASKFYVACTPKWWPSPAEMAEKCRGIEAAKTLAARPAPPPRTTGTVSLADNAMNSDLGRQAVDEGWASEFWSFVKMYGRWPDETETAGLKADSERNKAAREAMLASGDPTRVHFANKAIEARARLADLARPKKEEATDA